MQGARINSCSSNRGPHTCQSSEELNTGRYELLVRLVVMQGADLSEVIHHQHGGVVCWQLADG